MGDHRHTVANEFLDWYTDQLPSGSDYSHVISVLGGTGEMTSYPPDSPRVKEHLHNDATVYFRAPVLESFPETGRGRKWDPGYLVAFWLDVDLDVKDSAKNYPSREQADAMMARLPPPSALIESGGGFYPIWKFTEPLPSQDPETHRFLESLHNAAAPLWHEQGVVLDKLSDMGRVLRLPGSVNTKYPRNPKVTVEMTDTVYDPQTLLDTFQSVTEGIDLPGNSPLRATPTHVFEASQPTRTDVIHDHCDVAYALLTAGFEEKEGETFPTRLDQLTGPLDLLVPGTDSANHGKRSCVLNPSGVVFAYGSVPPSLEDLTETGRGVALAAVIDHLGIDIEVDIDRILENRRERHQKVLLEYREKGEIPADYPYAQGIIDQSRIMDMASKYARLQARQAVFPYKAFPEPIECILHAMEDGQALPPQVTSVAILSAIGAMCMGRFKYQGDANMEYPNVYAMIGAPSGAGKSPLERFVSAAAGEYEKKLQPQLRQRRQTLADILERKEKELKDLQPGDPEYTKLLEEISNMQITLENTNLIRTRISDTTPEAFERAAATDVGTWVTTTELSAFDKKFCPERGEDRTASLLAPWSGDNMPRVRVGGDQFVDVPGNASLLLMGQNHRVEAWLADGEKMETGLLARFLFGRGGTRSNWQDEISPPDETLKEELKNTLLAGYRTYDVFGDHKPITVITSEEARLYRIEWNRTIVAPVHDLEVNIPLQSFCMKYSQYAARIAALFAVYEWLEVDPSIRTTEVPVITEDIMRRGCAVTEWFFLNILQELQQDVVDTSFELLEIVQKAIIAQDNDGIFHATGFQRASGSRFRNAKEAKPVLVKLTEQGFIAPTPEHKTRYTLTDRGLERLSANHE